MKALTLHQPWATLIACGEKKIETRHWKPLQSLPITLAIHAGATMPTYAREFANQQDIAPILHKIGYMGAVQKKTGHHFEVAIDRDYLPISAIVAVVVLDSITSTDNLPASFAYTQECKLGDYSAGRKLWHMRDIRRLARPVPCKGALGLWDVPDDVLERINEQLAVRA